MASNDQSQYYNNAAASLAAQVAAQAAQLEFQRMRFQQLELPQFQSMSALDKEKLAFQKATEVWNQAFQEASVTGSYQGVPAAQYLLSASQVTGQFYQPGQLNAAQQAQYQTLQQQISTAQQQLVGLAPGTPEYATASAALATARAQLAPLQQIIQGTDKAPVQTLAGQNQQFQQQLALANLTGIVPTGTSVWGSPAGTGTQPGDTSGTDAGFYVWLKAHGYATLGDPAAVGQLPGLLATYAGLPAADHQAYTQAGAANPSQYTFDPSAWSQVPGLPAPSFTPVHEGAPGGMATTAGGAAGGAPTMAYTQMLASLTGMYNNNPTPEYQQMLAALTGQFNGQPTQAAMEFAKQFGLSEAAVTGMYQGNPTQAAKEFQARLALDTQHEQNTQANQMLQLAASLRGPRNAFQFAKVLGGTPQGLSDVLAAVSGRYNLPGYQGGGAAPEAVNVNNFMSDVYAATPAGGAGGYYNRGGYRDASGAIAMPTYSPGGGTPRPDSQMPTYAPQMNQWSSTAPSYQVNPPGSQAPSASYNYQPTGDGSQTIYPPGISAPVQAGQVSSLAPLSQSHLQNIGAQAMAEQPYMLPRPSQLNAENYNALGTYRQDLLKAAYENQGWDVGAFEDQLKQSLPTYGGPKTAKVAIPGL